MSFNPRTREGCDRYSAMVALGKPCFNPRTREGCDKRSNHLKIMDKWSFNPRTREGCDVNVAFVPIR